MKQTLLHNRAGLFLGGVKASSPLRAMGKCLAICAALFASIHLASATTQVNVQLTGEDDPVLIDDGTYWNVLEFCKGDCAQSITGALDNNGNSTTINVSSVGEYGEYDNGCADTGGGTITFQIDLPCGTFDIDPGYGIGSSSATITGGSFTGIQGPTTVYLSFLNNGYPITTADSITITGDISAPTDTQINFQLTGEDDPVLIDDGNYWNVLEFCKGDCSQSVTGALDIYGNGSGINVSSVGEYGEYDNDCADTGGGTITFEIDLPCGTFDIDPGYGIGSSSATITGGSFTGIQGPTTVYLDFLNNGYAITTAESIVINQY